MYFEAQTKIQTYILVFDNPLDLPDTCEVYALADVSFKKDSFGYYKDRKEIESIHLKIAQHYDETTSSWIDFSPIDGLRDYFKKLIIERVYYGND